MSNSIYAGHYTVSAANTALGAQGGAAKSPGGFGELLKEMYSSQNAAERVKNREEQAKPILSEREKLILELRSKIAMLETAINNAEKNQSRGNISSDELEEMKMKLKELKSQLYALQFNLA